ncbi:MAG: hypothetical protein ABSE63_12715 [Thermoguttaceae bacterium]
MDNQNLEAVKARADKDLEEVERLLNDLDYTFADGTAEAWYKQLKDHAKRCHEHSLEFLARRLESVSDRVQQRAKEFGEW